MAIEGVTKVRWMGYGHESAGVGILLLRRRETPERSGCVDGEESSKLDQRILTCGGTCDDD